MPLAAAVVAAGLLAASLLGSCGTTPLPTPDAPQPSWHEHVFTVVIPQGYQGPEDCLICHENFANDLRQTGHWNWEGTPNNIAGHENETHGKRDLINGLFIGVPSNEARCAQCHPSFGYTDRNFDFANDRRVDCFICHDTTGTYAKAPTEGGGGGQAALMQNGQLVLATPADLKDVIYNIGHPSPPNCGACHFYACGGDNVKHGDLSSALLNPTPEMDVHMGGQNFTCLTCHEMKNHGFSGFSLHSMGDGGQSPDCTRCHSATAPHTQDASIDGLLNSHLNRLACQLCHIPTFSRSKPTVVQWDWSTAGQDINPIPTDALGMPTYDKEKGSLTWAQNVGWTPRWFNGKWNRKIIGVADTYTNTGTANDPIVLAEPTATSADPDAKIYPFKVMYGRQPGDTVNKRLIVPHLFGSAAGPNAYWDKFDWASSLQEGAAYSGVPFSGTFDFPYTVTYLRVNHEVAPKSQARTCFTCHTQTWFWAQLGITDPLAGP
ncbi:MAG TPA: tetrathionate reductase family octaheme c-type cytochrome [Phycisphaerae bacterium]|nr:tetrathionate reductase family octaheme c-type cytochrome [Phycisphaerae bacterium]